MHWELELGQFPKPGEVVLGLLVRARGPSEALEDGTGAGS